MNNNELMHFGVKGMKWGVRRTPKQFGNNRLRVNNEANQDRYELAKKLANRRLDSDVKSEKLSKDYNERLKSLQKNICQKMMNGTKTQKIGDLDIPIKLKNG